MTLKKDGSDYFKTVGGQVTVKEGKEVVTITFNANGGTGSMPIQVISKSETAVLNSNTLTYTGHTFTGWNTAANGSGDSYSDGGNVALTDHVTLYAQWEPITHTVSFNANGGSGTMSPVIVNSGSSTAAPACGFTYAGHTFSGWNTAANGSGTSYPVGSSVSVSGDLTLYAQWAVLSYTVSYDANGGSGTVGSATAEYGTAVTVASNAFTYTGYRFAGWNTAADGSGTSYAAGASLTVESDVTLYAQWEEDITQEEEVVENPDGSTTVTETETVVNTDGSTTVTETVTEKDEVGNVTGTTETVTNTSVTEDEGSTTTVIGKTETVTETVVTKTVKDVQGGVLTVTETTVTADGVTTEALEVKAESEDGSITSSLTSDGAVETVVAASSDRVDDLAIELAVAQSDAVAEASDATSRDIRVEVSDGTAVTVSNTSMQTVAQRGASFTVVTQVGAMGLDNDVVINLSDPGHDVTVTMKEAEEDDLTRAQIRAMGDGYGISLTADVGGDRYHQLGGYAHISVPFKAPDSREYGVYYIDTYGARTLLSSEYVDGVFTFSTTHFSVFVIDVVDSGTPVDPDTPSTPGTDTPSTPSQPSHPSYDDDDEYVPPSGGTIVIQPSGTTSTTTASSDDDDEMKVAIVACAAVGVLAALVAVFVWTDRKP